MTTEATDLFQAQQYLANGGFLEPFLSLGQRQLLQEFLTGEEGSHFVTIVRDLKKRIESMPATYETDNEGADGYEAIVYLHYFLGGVNAWITEKDKGDGTDDLGQHQAFGRITFYGDPKTAEWGYISIAELIANDVELDLYWVPKSMNAVLGQKAKT